MNKITTIILSLFMLIQINAQEPVIEKGFLIIQSTNNYSTALKTAKKASQKLGIEINLRDYYLDQETGLLKTDFICGCGEKHDYIKRGRYDDGKYISIELSDDYEGLSNGYYIIVIASDVTKSKLLTKTLKEAKKYYTNAYIKNASIYLGCMH